MYTILFNISKKKNITGEPTIVVSNLCDEFPNKTLMYDIHTSVCQNEHVHFCSFRNAHKKRNREI